MHADALLIFGIGLLAQCFFSARVFVQWILSEKRHEVVSPSLFWIFSLTGSILFFLYGWLRQDFSIIFGQFISYYVYIGNLRLKGVLGRLPRAVPWLLVLIPFGAVAATLADVPRFIDTFLLNDAVPLWALVWGTVGQFVFTMRFVYQWLYSRHEGESLLPETFWLISLTGSLLIVSYGIWRADWILMLGQSFGLVAYIRNILIGRKNGTHAADGRKHTKDS